MQNDNERFFRELAKAYAENEGASLKDELAEIEKDNRIPQSSGLDRKIKNKLAGLRLRSYGLRAMPVAASLIIGVFLYNMLKTDIQTPPAEAPSASAPVVSEKPAPAASVDTDKMKGLEYTVELVSTRLPVGYTLTGIDYDNEAAIMEIMNEERNRIILTACEYTNFDAEPFTELEINGSTAYGLVKNDYSVLKYEKDGKLYTLTSMYGYSDLIEISKEIL